MIFVKVWRWDILEVLCKSVKDLIRIDYRMNNKVRWEMGLRRMLWLGMGVEIVERVSIGLVRG